MCRNHHPHGSSHVFYNCAACSSASDSWKPELTDCMMQHLVFYFTSAVLWLTFCRHCGAETSSTSLVDIYRPYLTHLPNDPASFNPFLGGQNFRICCQLAVNESLAIENDTLVIRPGQTFYRGDIAVLERFPQFPCVATFNGTMEGPPQDFWTPYSWCRRRCPGWSLAKPDNFSSWLKPLSAFILPSLIFCLSIPRRRRIHIPRTLFAKPKSLVGALFFLLKIPAASAIVSVEILVWLSVVFAISGPILVSTVYEALLDAATLKFLQQRIGSNSLSVRIRAHALLVVLLGNLDFGPAWHHAMLRVRALSQEPILARLSAVTTPVASSTSPSSLKTSFPGVLPATVPIPSPQGGVSSAAANDGNPPELLSIKSKLQAMLDSQNSFGTAVGVPVLFYVAAFSWSVYEIESSYGSFSSAHQLAFGLIWMIIPHIALVTSFLLAGSNPNVCQGIVPQEGQLAIDDNHSGAASSTLLVRQQHQTGGGGETGSCLKRVLSDGVRAVWREPSYKLSPYKAAWVWNRGTNKAMWIARLADEYHLNSIHDEILQHRFGSILWMSGLLAFVLIFIPVFFGALVSYTTPQVGFSCRSLTMLLYGMIQLVLILLSLADMVIWRRGADGRVIHEPDMVQKSDTVGGYVWYSAFTVSVLISVFTSLGGTVFMMIGLYSNCLCFIQARYWLVALSDPNALVFWNGATDAQLYYSMTWWFPAGVVAATFMVLVAYLGWWYQQHLRARFHDLVSGIDLLNENHLKESAGIGSDELRSF
ncbi:hypothetical protein QBC47DRAFT_387900 [Echria macrotheca]|uniref:Uncharacterized protein n=1 Tax=Echria macrotheca TaxID=438768 RepID=A0AAJ0F376_9PEZI|nr:hypothetical protein QBC47DRAFT_387900 [Echria macrotheca]